MLKSKTGLPDPTGEYRVFGPPGTGKTTHVAREVSRAVRKHGPSQVVAVSFTKAAAAELASRETMLPDRCVGTLHSFCYRALNCPVIAESRVKEWNALHLPAFFQVKDSGSLDDLSGQGAGEGLSLWNTHRARMVEDPPTGLLRDFSVAWEDWKRGNDYVDFTDLIWLSLLNVESFPGRPTIGFFDEAQDFTPLELALVRKWGEQMDFFVLVGDDDQCIYSFKGASPRAFLRPEIPDSHKIFLGQSYRVPRAVHAEAVKWTRDLGEREPKTYLPRDGEGAVVDSRLSMTGNDADELADDLVSIARSGRTAMVLATCGYMLGGASSNTGDGRRSYGVIDALRSSGVPFHNPYRASRGDWSPLKSGGRRLSSYMRMDPGTWGEHSRSWTWEELWAWTEFIPATGPDAVLVRGAKTEIRKNSKGEKSSEVVPLGKVSDLFRPGTGWWNGSPENLERLWSKTKVNRLAYPLRVVKRFGRKALIETPKIIVGTIHSVKGGEADVVYVAPNLSNRGTDEWTDPSTRDSVRRVFYVASTRARETLVKLNSDDCEGVW